MTYIIQCRNVKAIKNRKLNSLKLWKTNKQHSKPCITRVDCQLTLSKITQTLRNVSEIITLFPLKAQIIKLCNCFIKNLHFVKALVRFSGRNLNVCLNVYSNVVQLFY